jgi:hypothetical protein
MAKTVPYKLVDPITLGDVTYSDLTVRPPTVGDMIEASDGRNSVDVSALLIASIANVPYVAVKKMGLQDMEALSEILAGFRKAPPETGEPSSQI